MARDTARLPRERPLVWFPALIVGGDFNGDGKTDILFGDAYSNMVSALLDVSR
jgi:hypothetical protein